MSKSFWCLLGFGVTIRLLLSAITYHSDVAAFDFAGKILVSGQVLTMYDYLPNLAEDNPIRGVYPANLFNYPPSVYFFFAIPSALAGLLVSQDFMNLFIFDTGKLMGDLQLNVHLLLFKMPYIFLDVAVALMLMGIVGSQKEKKLAFALWMFNPITLYATFMVGQFDIIPVFFTVAALYLISKSARISLSVLTAAALLLGMGASFKIYPLFLLAPLASLTNKWSWRLWVIIAGALPYVLTILPYLPSSGFRSSALVANQTLKSLYSQIPISGGESIMLFLALLIFLYLTFLRFPIDREHLWQRFLLALLPFFIFTHYHPQWFLWLTPLLVVELITSGFKNLPALIIAVVSFTGLLFFFDPGLTVGLFSPISPSLYHAPDLWKVMGKAIDVNFARSILQTIFVGSASYFIYYYFPQKAETN